MKKFKFRLDTVLQVREKQEKKVQVEMAVIVLERTHEEKNLELLSDQRNDMIVEAENKAHLSAAELQADQAYLASLADQISQKKNHLNELHDREDEKRDELVKKMTDKKVLEKLKEKKKIEHAHEVDKVDQTMLDSIAHQHSGSQGTT
jgi:flagellar protein FliJ